ncbi:MAG: ABC transporter permease [Anaerolineae bacterium]|nr:ABC transporter permease [Anaerolineae bacterium]
MGEARPSDLASDALVEAVPEEEIEVGAEEERLYVASQWQLMWWKFRKHRMAMLAGVILIVLYFVGIFCEFVAPYDPAAYFARYKLAPPTAVHIFDSDGKLRAPFIYGRVRDRNPETLAYIYLDDPSVIYPIKLFVRGTPYKMWGLFEMDLHLFGIDADREEQGVFLFGADRLGRDLFSRVCYGARISLSIGMVGVLLSLFLGVFLGGISGYYGGRIDTIIQRVIEFIRTIPSIPLWMALSAALPADWPVIRVYFGITIILSLIGWTGMARVVRGRFLALREEDFVLAARLSGSNEVRIILRHMAPSFLSHIIASLTLSIPGAILGETGLSFIGLGLRAPAISWGVLLQEANNVRSLAQASWTLIPALTVILSVFAFNFLGDGLRDAADPYAR